MRGHFVYILKCKGGEFYTGYTSDPKRRLRQHNAGTASKYTRSRRPVVLAYLETCANRPTALRRELRIKKLSRAAKIALIENFRQKK